MPLPTRRLIWTFTLLFGVVTLATFLFSHTLRHPSLYFLRYASRLSDSLFAKGRRCAAAAGAEAEDDPWFAERFDPSVRPLMSRENSVVSPATLKWWEGLQPGKKDDFNRVVEELFRVFPGEAPYADAGPERCRTCAVVGNSGNLRGSRYGSLIDTRDFIIRMNQGPTDGFEEDVGSRTTHHVMYPESARDLDNATSLVLIPFKTLDLQWIISAFTTGTIKYTYRPVVSRIKANKDRVLIYSPTFFKYVYDAWLKGHGWYPSTGFLSLLLAIHICDEVSVFGFGADQYGNWHHYWEEKQVAGPLQNSKVHDRDYEYNVSLLLVEKGKIRMFKGS